MSPHELESYSIYVHVNKTNGKKYVGCTSKEPQKRWNNGLGYSNGQEKFYSAIKEFGWDGFYHVVLITNLKKEEALLIEERLIHKFNSIKNGYNATYGGEKNRLSEASKEKLRQQRLGEKNPHYNPNIPHGKTYIRSSTTHKIRNKKTYTFLPEETSKDGRKSIEFREALRQLKLGDKNPNYGKHSWCYGMKLSKEIKENIRKSCTPEKRALLRQQKLGSKNPQAKKVICLTTGEIYNTIVEAANANNISEKTISDCCNGKIKNPKLKFAFVKEGDGK